MQFDRREAVETRAYLKEMQKKGNGYASYPEEEPLRKDSIECFKESYEAAEHSYENTTDRDRYLTCRIEDLVQSLDTIIYQQQRMVRPKFDIERWATQELQHYVATSQVRKPDNNFNREEARQRNSPKKCRR
jgi:hypothetical protein